MAKTAPRTSDTPSCTETADRLPYDPVEWERRLARARTQREEALQRGAAPHGALAAAVPRARHDDIEPPVQARRLGRGRAWVPIAGALAVGFVAGASFDSLAAFRDVPPIADAALLVEEEEAPALEALSPATSAAAGPESIDPLPLETAALPREGAAPGAWTDAASQEADAAADPELQPVAAEQSPPAPEGEPEPDVGLEDMAEPGAEEADLLDPPEGARVVVLAPRSVPADVRDQTLSLLRENDWPAGEARTSPYTIRDTHVRFYHARDRAAAEKLAETVGGAARDFTTYSPSPDEGLLEVWLAGSAPARPARSRQPSADPGEALVRFLNRLAGVD